ncbi:MULTISPECIES: secretion protein EccK [unclassified Mycobacterium]|uniref:secretion protein EccK n=1 Tax=unclassified Mycobacterium TaxID=2642494 RepID=UPI0029C6357A|nr:MULTISPECIES: secretion protein EccK [unclassified Mycobacterium]
MGEHSQDGSAKATAGTGQTPLTPAQQQQAMLSDVAKGIDQGTQAVQANPMVSPANAAQLPVNPQVPVDAPAPPAAAAPGASGGGVPGGGGFSGGGGGGSSAAPVGGMSGPAPTPMPLGPPATPTPAAPVGSGSGSGGTVSGTPGSTPTGPGVHAASTANTSAAGIAAPAPIPVSAARMERDAMAASAAAGAARRQKNGGNDALTLARRIGAALNVGATDFGFFWVTGLCADGTIVVANSYGLGYIPENVNLPAQVQLVTADESIPPSERAKWATYPILAVQGWAQAHGEKLRAIVATEAQFANFDPGTAKVVLQPDDIPETGKMEGRSRLEVIAPAAASRLASVSDAGLMELLPPAPADPQPPADDSAMLWFDLCKPLMSTMPDRGIAHLEAFVTYSEHAQDLALYRAHTALDGPTQRAAIADWVYWQHLGVLMSDALSAEVAV